MKKLNKIINDPWRTTCAVCGSYEIYLRNGKIHRSDNPEEYEGEELTCDNCGDEMVVVYDKKQSKKVHYKTLL